MSSALSSAPLAVTFLVTRQVLITNTHRFENVVFTTKNTGDGGYEGESIAVGAVASSTGWKMSGVHLLQ